MSTTQSWICFFVAWSCLISCAGDDGGRPGATSFTGGGSATQGITSASASASSSGGSGASESGGEGSASGGDESGEGPTSGPKLDLDDGDDTLGGGGDCGPWTPKFKEAFAYIWIANSPEGTVSKIEVKTGLERARYRVGPGATNPSRTSVNLFGDVAVADRSGGITKIAGAAERCVESNGIAGIQTSQGAGELLPWGEDECVLWRVDLPDGAGMELHSAGPRPIAWEAAVDHALCPTANPRVWVGWYDYPSKTGNFRRLDGHSGAILDSVSVPQWGDRKHGPYGGAVDREGDFWALGWSQGPLVRIDSETLAVQRIEVAPPPGGAKFYLYGIAVDRDGNPWLAGEQTVYRYDAKKGSWTHLTIPQGRMRGLQIDRFGRAFIALNNPAGLVVVDTESASIVAPTVTIPGAMMPVGVSVDVDGAVWVVDRDADRAFKIDPVSYAVLLEVEGLTDPYTYSDMTGAGLSLVTYPPQG